MTQVYGKKKQGSPNSHGHCLAALEESTFESEVKIVSCGFLWGVQLSGWHGHLHWTNNASNTIFLLYQGDDE